MARLEKFTQVNFCSSSLFRKSKVSIPTNKGSTRHFQLSILSTFDLKGLQDLLEVDLVHVILGHLHRLEIRGHILEL